MKQSKRINVLLALVLSLCMFLANGAIVTFADNTNNSNIAQTYSFVDLPYHTGYSNFGYYNAGYVDYTLKVGHLNAESTNYGLSSFDTWDNSNTVTLSTISGLTATNWKWTFAKNTSVVVEVKSKIEGTVKFDFSDAPLAGWHDNYNLIHSVHVYNAETAKLNTLVNYFKGKDTITENSLPTDGWKLGKTYTISVDVKENDVIYYEIGALDGRNLEQVDDGKIIVTPSAVNEVVHATYAGKLDAKVGALVEANYAPSDWTAIGAIVTEFKDGSFSDVEGLLNAYNSAVSSIDAIQPDPLKDMRTNLINSMNSHVGSLIAGNYTTENWAIITGAKDAFVAGAEECETSDALQALYDEKMASINAVKPYKQEINYLDYPSTMNANGYSWIEGEIFNTKLYTGTVENIKEFDTQGDSQHKMYNADLAATAPGAYAENWRWFIGNDVAVIVAYEANVDLKLDIICTRSTSKDAIFGWVEDTELNYYIVRDGVVKKFKTVNAPSTDAAWSGEFYLKAGDMLYVEFKAAVVLTGEALRNTQTPCNTVAEADSTAFNQDLYAEQNNDRPAEVVNEINAKKVELQNYYASLTESDYSATNWLTLAQYIEQFVEACEGTESTVKTVDDVVAVYNQIKAEMEAVQTLAEAAAELQTALEGYASEVQAEYDSLVANNHYTDENKAVLDKALADGKAAILAARSKTAGNQEKIKAIAALKAVEVSEKPETNSCFASLSTSAILPILLAVGCAIIAKKRKED